MNMSSYLMIGAIICLLILYTPCGNQMVAAPGKNKPVKNKQPGIFGRLFRVKPSCVAKLHEKITAKYKEDMKNAWKCVENKGKSTSLVNQGVLKKVKNVY